MFEEKHNTDIVNNPAVSAAGLFTILRLACPPLFGGGMWDPAHIEKTGFPPSRE